MVKTMWEMSVVNEWGVILIQSEADYSLEGIIDLARMTNGNFTI